MTAPDRLEQLTTSNRQRIANLEARGFRLGGLDERWVATLLNAIGRDVLGDEAFNEQLLAHARWVQVELDQAEATARDMDSQRRKAQLAVPGPGRR